MKKMYILVFFLLFTFVPTALAHSNLESSSPQNGEIVQYELSTISITFNTRIEDTSTLKIKDLDGQELPLEKFQVKENEMVANLNSPLDDGKYIVVWKIIGEDGHPIENSYSFTVDTASDTNAEISSKPMEDVKENGSDTIQIVKKEAPSSKNIQIVSLLLLFLIALGSTIWLMKRGKK